jgi:1-acyl-sn-glycerol-3-phosphate acyltransferase
MMGLLRTAWTMVVLGTATVVYGSAVLLADLVGVRYAKGGVYDRAPKLWARAIAWSAGMRVHAHGLDALNRAVPHIYMANHVSVMDIPAILHVVPDPGFLAKRELSKIPLFGAAAARVGVVYIDRDNRKSAFASIEEAAEQVRSGRSVIVFPEGTRGKSYTIRPFKKGPFVLAISAGIPIVPVLIYGTREITPNRTLDVAPGTVHVHLLEPIPTAGFSFEERAALAERVRERLAEALATLHGVDAPLERDRSTSATSSMSSTSSTADGSFA